MISPTPGPRPRPRSPVPGARTFERTIERSSQSYFAAVPAHFSFSNQLVRYLISEISDQNGS